MDAWSRQDFDAETPRDRVVLMPEIPTQLVPSSPSRLRGNSVFWKTNIHLPHIQDIPNSFSYAVSVMRIWSVWCSFIQWNQHGPWKMVGKLLSFLETVFSGAMLVSERVPPWKQTWRQKITFFYRRYRRYIFIHGCFAIVKFVFGGVYTMGPPNLHV